MDRQVEWTEKAHGRKWWPIVSVVVGVLLLSSLGYAVSVAWSSDADSNLIWSEIRRGTLELQSLGTGEFVSTQERLISAPEQGVVENVLCHAGDAVKRGDVIMRLRSPQLLLEMDSAASALAQVKIQDLQTQSNAALALARARQAFDSARLDHQVATTKLAAYSKLVKKKVVSQLQFLTVQAKYRQTKGALQSARKMLNLTRKVQDQQREQMDESVHLANIKYKRLQERVTGLEIKAGTDGVVKDVAVKLGDAVRVGSQLASVGRISPDRARLKFPERDLAGLKLGSPVTLRFNGQVTSGSIVRISPDLTHGYITVDVATPNLPPIARVGMAVRGEADLGTLADVLYAPSTYDAPVGGSLRVRRRRNGATRTLTLHDVKSAGGKLVFSSGVMPGDKIAVLPDL